MPRNLINIKPVFLFVILVFFITPVILLLIGLSVSRPQQKQPTPTPPIKNVSPTATTGPSNQDVQNTLFVVRAAPLQALDLFYLPVQPIELTFTSPISPENLKYTVSPFVETKTKQGTMSTSVIVYPAGNWKSGLTTVTIGSGTKSSSGSPLSQDFIYYLNTSLPRTIPPNAADY